jgi:hypothetical protein
MIAGRRSGVAPRRVLGAPSSSTGALRAALAAVVLCMAAVLGAGSVLGEESALDPSDVVLAFDFSNSILLNGDKANEEFAMALRKIADRVALKADDLMAGDATISFEAFGGKAVTIEGCTQLSLHGNPNAVGQFETCLRDIASEYDLGGKSSLRKRVGSADTDHVAALEKAAGLLPVASGRPAVIFFTDGRNEPADAARAGEDVAAEIQPFFADFQHIAILPVGLGPEAPAFVKELEAIRTIRGMEACGGQDTLTWSDVVFPSPQGAGLAVATALQKVTCSYLVETPSPTPGPSPTPTPVPTPVPSAPGPPQGVAAAPTNEGLLLTWAAPASIGTSPITGYTVHCNDRRIHHHAGPAQRPRARIPVRVPGGRDQLGRPGFLVCCHHRRRAAGPSSDAGQAVDGGGRRPGRRVRCGPGRPLGARQELPVRVRRQAGWRPGGPARA